MCERELRSELSIGGRSGLRPSPTAEWRDRRARPGSAKASASIVVASAACRTSSSHGIEARNDDAVVGAYLVSLGAGMDVIIDDAQITEGPDSMRRVLIELLGHED